MERLWPVAGLRSGFAAKDQTLSSAVEESEPETVAWMIFPHAEFSLCLF